MRESFSLGSSWWVTVIAHKKHRLIPASLPDIGQSRWKLFSNNYYLWIVLIWPWIRTLYNGFSLGFQTIGVQFGKMSISALRNLHKNFPLNSWSSWICEITIWYLTPLFGSFALMGAHMVMEHICRNSARNNSRPLAIFLTILSFNQPPKFQ